MEKGLANVDRGLARATDRRTSGVVTGWKRRPAPGTVGRAAMDEDDDEEDEEDEEDDEDAAGRPSSIASSPRTSAVEICAGGASPPPPLLLLLLPPLLPPPLLLLLLLLLLLPARWSPPLDEFFPALEAPRLRRRVGAGPMGRGARERPGGEGATKG